MSVDKALDVSYLCKATSEISQTEKEALIDLLNDVSKTNYNLKWFDWKYINNIYGDSYIVLAYCENKLVGLKSFWRNDIDDNSSYQLCDTAVHKDFKNKNFLSEINKSVVEKTKDSFIYSFSKDRELDDDFKLSWKVNKCYYLKMVVLTNELPKKTKFIEDDYLIWKFGESPINDFYYYDIEGCTYLLFKRKKSIYYILGRFNSEYKYYFKPVNFPILFYYSDKETMIGKILKDNLTIVNYKTNVKVKIDVPISKSSFI